MNTRHEGSDDGAVAGDEALEHGRLEGPSAGGTRGRTVEICGMENLRANCAFWSPTFFRVRHNFPCSLENSVEP